MKNKIYERLWDCPACPTIDISALRLKKCPNCGYNKTSQDKERRTRIEVTDDFGLALARGGANWTCSSCGSTNLKKDKVCTSCSNEKDKSDDEHKVQKLDTQPPPIYSAKDSDSQFYEFKEYERVPASNDWALQSTFAADGTSSLNPTTIKYGIIGLVVIVLVVLIGYGVFDTKNIEGKVTSFSWSRDVVIERYETVHHTDKQFTPADAYNITSRQVSRQVPVYRSVTTTRDCSYTVPGTCTDLGNGAESCSPDTKVSQTCTDTTQVIDHYDTVWDTYYSYDRDEWVYEWTAYSSGNDRSPYWPEYTLNHDGQVVLGAERIGSVSQTYIVYFEVEEKDEVKVYSFTTSEFEWNQYVESGAYPLKINYFDAIMNNPLQDKINFALTAQSK